MTHARLKREITVEAARLMTSGQESHLARARMAAARSLQKGWVHPSNFPSDLEIRDELQLAARLALAVEEESDAPDDERFRLYRQLLEPLAQVLQPRDRHPEGDALYHSLQVFERTRRESPWDEELLLAALLHDVGKAIDPLDHVDAGLQALAGSISPRTAWLIEHHGEAQRIHDGTIGQRALRRLREHEDFDSLLILARCDREGRVPGGPAPDLDEALAAIREVVRFCDG